MTLVELRTALNAAKTGTDIEEVYFDYNSILNETLKKTYPLILWDIDNSEGLKQIRSSDKFETITMNCWAVNQYVVDADKIPDWDTLIADIDEYLLKVDTSEFVKVKLNDVVWELFPEGFSSVDRELAVLYRITLELWC